MTYAGGFSNHTTVDWGGGYLNVIFDRPSYEIPTTAHSGPAEWSTSGELEPDPVVIHDVNSYYRALGFSWPFRGITKKKLLLSYMECGGPDNAYATYAFKQLLNPELRRTYDRAPIGALLFDEYVKEMLKKRAAEEASRRRHGPHVPTIDDVLAEWGLTGPASNEPVSDADQPLVDSLQDPLGAAESDDTVPETWPWNYWLWKTRCQDTDRLARWQLLLLAAARQRGLRVRLSVGFAGRIPQGFVRLENDGRVALLLEHETEPTPELAAQAVDFEHGEMIKKRPKMIKMMTGDRT